MKSKLNLVILGVILFPFISISEELSDVLKDAYKFYPDIEKSKNSIVPGALFEISKSDEKKLDVYEDFPILYKKLYFTYYNRTVMTYTMVNKTKFRYPTERYLNVVKQGYKDCKLNFDYLTRAINKF